MDQTDDALPLDEHSTLLLKQRELELLKARLALVKDHGLAFYRPHEKQHLYHSSPAKRRGLFAGNRFGKSEASAAETVAWFLGERTWYKYIFPIFGMREGKKVVISMHEGHENHPLVRQGIPRYATKQLIITTDWKKVDIVWTSPAGAEPGKLWKFIPRSAHINTKKNHEGVIDQVFNEDTGSIIRFTTEQAFLKNPQSVESTDNDRVGIDEPVVHELWVGVARGLIDRDGQADFTLTSLRERWIYDYFNPEESPTESRDAVRATTYDNPYNTPEAIARFELELTEEERSCRLNGLPLELSGLVYKEFSKHRHVLTTLPPGWSSWDNPPLDYTIYTSLDTHIQTPNAGLFAAVAPTGTVIVYSEIWSACVADDLAVLVNSRHLNRSLGFIKCDPFAWIEDPVYRMSMAVRLSQLGVNVEKASKAKDFGITNMRSLLKQDKVFFAPSLKRFFWEISRYHYDKDNKPVDKDDHLMECMYRLFINPLTYIDPFVPSSAPQFEIPMTTRALRDFDYDSEMFNRSLN